VTYENQCWIDIRNVGIIAPKETLNGKDFSNCAQRLLCAVAARRHELLNSEIEAVGVIMAHEQLQHILLGIDKYSGSFEMDTTMGKLHKVQGIPVLAIKWEALTEK